MTFVYQQREFLLLVLQAFLCGAALGVLYDASRLIRMALGVSRFSSKEPRFAKRDFALIGRLKSTKRKEGKIAASILFVFDLLFMIVAACAVLCVLFFRNDGRFRWIVLLFAGGGFACYYVSIGYLVMRFCAVIICVLRILSAYVIFFVTYPVKYAAELVRRVFGYLARETAYRMRAVHVKREATRARERLLLCAENGFLRDVRKEKLSVTCQGSDKKKQDEKIKEDSKNVRIGKKLFPRLRKSSQKN